MTRACLSHRRRYGLRLAAAFLLAASTLLLHDALAGDVLEAAPAPGAQYAGTISDGGRVTIDIDASATTATLSFQFAGPSPAGCAGAYSQGAAPLGQGGAFFQVKDATATGYANIDVIGYFDSRTFSAVAGALTMDPAPGAECPRRRVTWAAAIAQPVPGPGAATSSTYTGVTFAAQGGPSIGAVTVTTTAAGEIASFTASALEGGCDYRLTTGALAPAVALTAGSHAHYTATPGGSFSAVVGSASGRAALAGGWVARGTADCADFAGSWLAAAPTAARGRLAPPPAFGTGNFAQAVFGGGTVAELAAVAREAGASSVWVQDATGNFHLLIIDGPAFVNAGLIAAFPAGFGVISVTVVR